jgi:hypothetical protein
MRHIERTLTVALFPFSLSFRLLGMAVWETLELWEELRSHD